MPEPLSDERFAEIRDLAATIAWESDAALPRKLAGEDVPALAAEIDRLREADARAATAEADGAALRSLAHDVLDDLEHGRVHHARRTLREALGVLAAGREGA